MNLTRVRLGVIGAGYWGPNLIRNCAELGVLDAICDIDDAALAAARQAHPSVFTTKSVRELLGRQIDGVVIAAPAQLHAQLALEAIAAGKHVFVEKPLALSIDDGMRVLKAAQAARLQVMVGHVLLYHPAIRKLRSLVADKAIGDVWHIRSRRLGLGKLRAHENVWWSFAPHDVAVVLALAGTEPVAAVSARTANRVLDIADAAYTDYFFANGTTAHVEVCWLDPERSARLDVFGRTGVLTFDDRRGAGSLHLTPAGAELGGGLGIWRNDPQDIEFEAREPLGEELRAFIDAIVSESPPEADAREGLAVLRALEMADKAAGAASVTQEVTA